MAHRMNLKITDKTKESIEELQELMDASSASEAIRRALTLAHYLYEQQGQVYIKLQDGTHQIVPLY